MHTTTKRSFLERLSDQGVLIADGATATNYHACGLGLGTAPEQWLFDAPQHVLELHRAYVEAGADVILTCSFGGTRLRLSHSPALADRPREVNLRAAELAGEASDGRALVAGTMGPTGQLLKPLGPLDPAECTTAFAEQAEALTEGGVDLLLIETLYSLEEAVAAIVGTRSASSLPVVVSFSFDMGGRTMTGLSPTAAVSALEGFDVAAVGANCGDSLDTADNVARELVAAAGDIPVWIKPNAGKPRIEKGAVVYDVGPETLALHAQRYVEHGARIVGGCCGSTPGHIEAISHALGRRGRGAAV
jgi:5-methyltetrahydrofolate--homocysteine methyltransferase